MKKFKTKRFGIRFGCGRNNNSSNSNNNNENVKAQPKGFGNNNEIKWEVRPGGMLVQKREESVCEDLISIRVSTFAHFHDLSIDASSTFGELKMIISLLTGLEPKEQRLLFKGKERDDYEYLHMVGVRDKDKVFMLEDPAIKEMKLHGHRGNQTNIGSSCPTIIV